MKGGIAGFIAAALDAVRKKPRGSVSLLITADEEGPSINGTRKALDWMKEKGEMLDFCIVGEPTSDKILGDTVKIGRRGSLTGTLTVKGIQGHVAYPQLADNPVPKLLALLKAIDDLELDKGTPHFQPSNLEIVNIEASRGADNVIPAWARALFNVRFNDLYTGGALEDKLRAALDAVGVPYDLTTRVSGESFYTPPGKYSDMVAAAVMEETGRAPVLSTSGGTSDARFIRAYCPVVECGVSNATAHKVDERVPAADIVALSRVYAGVLRRFFA
jgi:succinyl-diaminopimelate desuccinylase